MSDRVEVGGWYGSGELVSDVYPAALTLRSRARVQAAKQILGEKFSPTVALVIFNPTREKIPGDAVAACALLTDDAWEKIDALSAALVESGAVS